MNTVNIKTKQCHIYLPSSPWAERTDTVSWREPDLDEVSKVVVLDRVDNVESPVIQVIKNTVQNKVHKVAVLDSVVSVESPVIQVINNIGNSIYVLQFHK